jgi:hypothetical protein
MLQHNVRPSSCCFVLHNALQRLIHSCPAQLREEDAISLEFGVIELFSDHTVINSIICNTDLTRSRHENNHKQCNGTFHPIRLEGHYNDSLEHHLQCNIG